jgi:hypothetical protein
VNCALELFEGIDYTGRLSAGFTGGNWRLGVPNPADDDFPASAKVRPGSVALLYQHVDAGGGYGVSVDLMEDCPDLAVYGLRWEVSYVSIFEATRDTGHIWVRGKGSGDSYVPGHWERPRASGVSPNDVVGAPSPPLPPHQPPPNPAEAPPVSEDFR